MCRCKGCIWHDHQRDKHWPKDKWIAQGSWIVYIRVKILFVPCLLMTPSTNTNSHSCKTSQRRKSRCYSSVWKKKKKPLYWSLLGKKQHSETLLSVLMTKIEKERNPHVLSVSDKSFLTMENTKRTPILNVENNLIFPDQTSLTYHIHLSCTPHQVSSHRPWWSD